MAAPDSCPRLKETEISKRVHGTDEICIYNGQNMVRKQNQK